MFTSPNFASATIAYAKYCTGDSLTSNNNTASYFNNTQIYFKGRPMLDALYKSLMIRGLATANAVLYSGCSAGALTAYTHIDYFATLLPANVLLLGLADAMFALNVSVRNYIVY